MKLTADQRKLLDDTVLAVIRAAPHALRFVEIDSRTRVKIGGDLGRDWSFRFTDGALQRLRRAGFVKTTRQRWTPAIHPITAQNES